MKEIWKDCIGYEGYYQISNKGRVKSLPRKVRNGRGVKLTKEIIMKPTIQDTGYFQVGLTVDNVVKKKKIHQLMAESFMAHVPCGCKLVVDHINNIKTDNRLANLQVITNRENSSKDKRGASSKYIGVHWKKNHKKCYASIRINGKNTHLGCFSREEDAAKAYQDKLKEETECYSK